MTSVVFERVVSYSSEDPKYPARNLLHFGKPWRCAPGALNATIILQLDEPRLIESIDIGNDHSAFVHVLVGRAASDEFHTLLPASSFMTPEESARGEHADRVRMFVRSDFLEPTASEKWDRIKIVCSQPFNRKVQFGLAFFVVRRPEEPGDKKEQEAPAPRPRLVASPSPASPLGRFTLKKDDKEDDVTVGSLFARHRANGSQGSSSKSPSNSQDLPEVPEIPDVSLSHHPDRPATSTADDNPPPPKKVKVPDRTAKPHKAGKLDVKVGKDDKANKVKKENTNKKKAERAAVVDVKANAKTKPLQQQHQPTKLCKPFNRLLEGVVFSMSGFVNPLRATLREQALEMGAKYRPDWDSSCTHLICAFKNTPKFRQVQGQGRIVQKDWIQQCYSKRKRFPWRRFALDINDFKQPESEDEIVEEVAQPVASSSRNPATTTPKGRARGAEGARGDAEEDRKEEEASSSRTSPLRPESGSDTEEEIERLKNKAAASSRAYLTDTDTDEEEEDGNSKSPGKKRSVTSHLPLPSLPHD